MKLLLIGYGKVGSVLAKLLAGRITGRNIQVTGTYYKRPPEKTARGVPLRKLDASSSKEVLKLLSQEKPDILVNCALPKLNTLLLECCLRKGCNYMDLCSLWEHDPNPKAKSPYMVEQLQYHEAFKKQKLTGLINAGVSPGLSNLLAGEAAAHSAHLTHVKIRLLEECKTRQPFFAWSAIGVLNEMLWKPLVWRDGNFQIKDRFSEEESCTFPSPFGKKKVWLVAQEEVGTIPLFLKVDNCDIKQHDHFDFAKTLDYDRLELQELLKRFAAKSKGVKHEKELKKAVFGLLVEAGGTAPGAIASGGTVSEAAMVKSIVQSAGRISKADTALKEHNSTVKQRYSVLFPSQREVELLQLGANYITYPTALMASLFLRAFPLFRKDKKFHGVFPPEALSAEARAFVLGELKKVNGVMITGF